jgi:hypothetical protein
MNNTKLASTPTHIGSRQIGVADIPEVVNLLTRGFGTARTRGFWEHILDCLSTRSVPAGYPRFGYIMESDGKLVGVIILIFSILSADGAKKIRCNVSSWYVDPAFRGYASLLASRALRYKNVTVLNVSAADFTRTMVDVWGFTKYSNGVFAAIPALSRPPKDIPVRVIDAHAQPDVPFDPNERDLLLDHANYGCMSLWCVTPEWAYPFVFRTRRAKVVLPCAQLVYCRNIDDFVRFARPIGMFLARSMRLLVIVDANDPVSGLIGKYFPEKMPKYFIGPDRPRIGDLAYTETAMFGV